MKAVFVDMIKIRIKNKEGKDYKKSESYDPDYYLSLKEHENKQNQQHGK